MHRFIRHLFILFIAGFLAFILSTDSQAQIAGSVQVDVTTPGSPCSGGSSVDCWNMSYPTSFSFNFAGGSLPGITAFAFYQESGAPGGQCNIDGTIASMDGYPAYVLNNLPVVVDAGATSTRCDGVSLKFRWIPQNMPVPVLEGGTNSICSGAGFTLKADLPVNSKVDNYYWYRSTNPTDPDSWTKADGTAIVPGGGGTSKFLGQGTSTTVTTNPDGTLTSSLSLTAPTGITSATTYYYRIEGYRNGQRVAAVGGYTNVFVFPPPPDATKDASNQYIFVQDNTWRPTETIPITINGVNKGTIQINNLTCKGNSDATISIIFNDNITGQYKYYLAPGRVVSGNDPPIGVMNIVNPAQTSTFPDNSEITNRFNLTESEYTLVIENQDKSQNPVLSLCFERYLIKIKAPTAPSANITSPINPTCINGSNGSITIAPSGGAAAISGSGESYTIQLFDDEGNLEATRSNLSTGNQIFSGLSADSYYFMVTETGCGTAVRYPSGSTYITLSDPTPAAATAAVSSEIVCEGGTGSIKVDLTQGNTNGTYTIEAFRNGNTTAEASVTGIKYDNVTHASHTFNGLPTGSYTFRLSHTCGIPDVLVIDGADEVTLTDVTPVAGNVAGLKKAGSTFELTCNGATDGQIQVSLTTGKTTTPNNVYSLVLKRSGTVVSSHTYVASGAITPINIKVGETLTYTGLSAGTYTIEVSQNNCTGTTKTIGTATLTPPPSIAATFTPVTKFGSFQVSCASGEDGEIVVSNVSGGNGSYTIEIYENGTLVTPTATNKVIDAGAGTTTFKELRPKNFQGNPVAYTIKITDSKGCELNSATLELEAPTAISSILTPTAVTCKGESNGSITAQISGGTRPYTIEWRDSGGAALLTTTLGATVTSHTLSGQPAGTYTFRVKDVNNCPVTSVNGWHENTATITEPANPLAFDVPSFIIDSASCNGVSDGRITLAATGGWGSYEYSLDGGTTYQSSPVFSGLAAGTYTVYLKDVQNCVVTTSVEVKQPTVLALAQTQITQVSCNGGYNGSFVFTAQGGNDAGSQPYTILVNGAAYNETDWSSWVTTKQITLRGLAASNYTIQATDSKGCNETLNFTITEPTQLAASVSNIVAATCGERNGSAQVTTTGGTTPYTYAWKKHDAAASTLRTWSTTTSLSGAEGGAYEMIVTDALGCSITQVVQVSNADAAKTTIQNITATTCAESKDGTATLQISGEFPIEVTWVDAANETGTITWQNATTVQLTGLSKGYHDFQTKDSKGCVRFETVLVPGPETLLITRNSTTDPTCHNASDGSLSVTVTGGTAPYTINWDNGLTAGATSFNNLAAGTYTVQVTDANDCQRQASFILQNPLPISVDLGTGSTVCEGQSVTLRPTIPAGNTIANYRWTSASGNFISAASEITVSAADTYFLQVTTTTGCTGTGEYKLETATDAFEADFLMNDEAVVGDTVVAIEVCRPAPTTLFWDIESLGDKVEVLESTVTNARQSLVFKEPGTYTVKLYASAGTCQDVFEQQITVTKADGQRIGNTQSAQTGRNAQQIQARVNPNPISDGKFKLSIDLATEESVKVEMFSLTTGKRWRMPQPLQGAGQTHYEWQLEMPQLTYGTYAVRIQTPTRQKIVKVVVN